MDKETKAERYEQFKYLYNERLSIMLEDPNAIKAIAEQQARNEVKELIKEYYPDEKTICIQTKK